tara:strand:+ start:151724 stop:151831 length:108 start_codon:yes stop_codon:yes gene_type:complete
MNGQLHLKKQLVRDPSSYLQLATDKRAETSETEDS